MRSDRFLVNFQKEGEIIRFADKNLYHQIKKVLRKRPGEEIFVFNKEGEEFKLALLKITPQEIEGKILEKIETKKELNLEISLYCALLKKANFEWVVQKTTELGIKEITPLLTTRTIKLGINFSRLEKIIKEATEQSNRSSLPLLKKPLTFPQALEETKNYPAKILFDYSGKDLSQVKSLPKKVAIFIGPEGGWTEEELASAQKANFLILNLSHFNLRAETAAIVASFWTIMKAGENPANSQE